MRRIDQAIRAFQERRFVIIFSEGEDEADLAIPASEITAEAILFAARVASGLLCLALPRNRLQELDVDALPSRYRSSDTPFHSPVDAREVENSGISPKDRAFTIRKVIDPDTHPEDLARPGHVQMLGAHPDGLLGRDGHTEAVVTLCKLAGLYPGGVLCEIISDTGDMMNATELRDLARRFNIPMVSVGALARFARKMIKGLDKGTKMV